MFFFILLFCLFFQIKHSLDDSNIFSVNYNKYLNHVILIKQKITNNAYDA